MDDFMFFGFAGNVQSDELTQDGSDRDWQEYNEWLAAQEREEENDIIIDPSGGCDDSDDAESIYDDWYANQLLRYRSVALNDVLDFYSE